MKIFPSKRRLLRWGIGFGLVIALLLIVNAIFAWRTERRLQNKLAEIRAAGDPASIADLAPEPIPADQNAAIKLKQMKPRLREFAKQHGEFFKTPIGKAYEQTIDGGGLATSDQLAAIDAVLANFQDLDRNLSEVAAYEQYASQANFALDHYEFIESNLEDIQEIRTAARFVDWQMQSLTGNGQQQESIERGIELLKIARLYDSEPLLVNFLVGAAIRGIAARSLYDALAAGSISPDLHRQLDEELALHDDPGRMARTLKTERAISANFAASGGLPTRQFQANAFVVDVLGWPIKRYYIGVLDLFDEQLELADRPWYEVTEHIRSMKSSPDGTGHGVLADLLLPALEAAHQANARNLAVLRALRIYNKLREYAQANGHEATSLDDLDLPTEATIDPYTGDPLKIKLTDEGWVVYSVGENGADDGGVFKDQKDIGVAPPKHRAD